MEDILSSAKKRRSLVAGKSRRDRFKANVQLVMVQVDIQQLVMLVLKIVKMHYS